MSQQGPEFGEEDDWWSQLYDPQVPDTGGTPERDTLDDRFASASRALGRVAPVPGPRSAGDRPRAHTRDGLGQPDVLPPADPASLAELTPDTALDGAEHGAVTFRAASLRGERSRQDGAPRREAHVAARFGEGESGLLLLAVASGGDGADGARRAAREVCLSVGEAVGRSHARLADDLRAARRDALKPGLHRLTDRTYGKLRARAAALGLEPGAYTADLRCLLVPADTRCRLRVFFGVGPGGLFRLRDGVWRDVEPPPAASPVPSGESSPGPALPAGGPWPQLEPSTPAVPFRFRATEAGPEDLLLMCSEGLAEPLRADRSLARRLAGRWGDAAGPPDPAAFLADVRTPLGTGHAADRTAVAVWER